MLPCSFFTFWAYLGRAKPSWRRCSPQLLAEPPHRYTDPPVHPSGTGGSPAEAGQQTGHRARAMSYLYTGGLKDLHGVPDLPASPPVRRHSWAACWSCLMRQPTLGREVTPPGGG